MQRRVAKWGKVGYRVDTLQDRGGGAPPTPPPRSESSSVRMTTQTGDIVGLPRSVRLLARRQEAAERPGEVPPFVLGRADSSEVARALRCDLGAPSLRGFHRQLPARAQPAVVRAAQA